MPDAVSPLRSPWRRVSTAAVALCCAALAVGVLEMRRDFIASWFRAGPAHPPPRLALAPAPGEASGPLPRVRVLLVDGLTRRTADALPALRRLCSAGLRLSLDVGWPTVSHPVQHALWTGTWQTQSGVLYTYRDLPSPVFPTVQSQLALRRGSSVAVAEAHPEIAGAFAFDRLIGPSPEPEELSGGPTTGASSRRRRRGPSRMTPAQFQRRAIEAARSDAPLVFLHQLAVDIAGHRAGARSRAYRRAARQAGALIAALDALRRSDGTLIVLSDHGHLVGGGHGGDEPRVRWVRACLAGEDIPVGTHAVASVVDLNRAIAERLGLPPPRYSQGRPLAALIDSGARRSGAAGTSGPPRGRARPEGGLGRPRPPEPIPPSWAERGPPLAVAALLLFGLLTVSRRDLVAFTASLPWAAAAGALAVGWALGWPSLSHPYLYPRWPSQLALAALPAVSVTGLQLWVLFRRRLPPVVAALCCAAGQLFGAALALAATGWPLRVPPLLPRVSAWVSVMQATTALSLAATGLWLVLAVWSRRGDRGRTSRS